MNEIPKIVHYCWFGKNPVPEEMQRYINAWQEMCPEYVFMKWDESNFDINKYEYTKQAYENKKWAFVSDVCRLEKMYEYGGVYLDVKTEILKPFDDLLDREMVIGFEQDNLIMGAFFMAKKEHSFIKSILDDYYKNEKLLDNRGKVNDRTINSRIQEQMKRKGLKSDNTYQELDQITVYPKEFFCPTYWNSPKLDPITDNTYIKHYFGGSWHNKHDRRRLEVLRQEPLVSIVVPVYRVEKYLHECVESLIKQTYKNIEIILVDDKSPDKSGDLCDVWAKNDKRIKVIHNTKNEGLNMARKTGFEASRGQYIAFLDSDDYFHMQNIEMTIQALCDNDADVTIYASKEFSDYDKEDIIVVDTDRYETKVLKNKKLIVNYAFFGNENLPGVQYMTVWGKLYARKIVEGVDWGAANYRMYEDSFWTPQVLLKASKVVLTSSQLIFYRRNIAYGVAGNNLGNRLTGNSINGMSVGYIEYVYQMRQFYLGLARTYGFESTLDDQIYKQTLIDITWRIDNLVKANLLNAENNLKFVLEILPQYIEAKNKHIDNLDVQIDYLSKNSAELNQNLAESNLKIAKLEDDNKQLNQKIIEYSGVKRSARLLAGNLKRKAKHFKN